MDTSRPKGDVVMGLKSVLKPLYCNGNIFMVFYKAVCIRTTFWEAPFNVNDPYLSVGNKIC
jgi:hypothetical protein